MKKRILWILTFILISFFIWSESYLIEYLVNTVELKQDTKWIKLEIGDELDSNSVVKVSRGGSLEFLADKSKITISANGTYNLKDILKSSKDVASWGLETILKAKFSAITGEPKLNTQAAAQGVRANDLQNNNGVEFEDFNSAINNGILALENNDNGKAIVDFIKAREYAADDNELKKAKYYLSQAYMSNEQYILAQMELMDIKVTPEDTYYPGYIILQGNLYLKSTSFDAANQLFQEYVKKVKDKRVYEYQTICFLSSIAYRGLKNPAKTKEYLTLARDLKPESLIGATAARMISEL